MRPRPGKALRAWGDDDLAELFACRTDAATDLAARVRSLCTPAPTTAASRMNQVNAGPTK